MRIALPQLFMLCEASERPHAAGSTADSQDGGPGPVADHIHGQQACTNAAAGCVELL